MQIDSVLFNDLRYTTVQGLLLISHWTGLCFEYIWRPDLNMGSYILVHLRLVPDRMYLPL